MALGDDKSSNAGAEDYNFIEESDEDVFSDTASESDFEEVPEALEPVVPRSLKRTYGVMVDEMFLHRQHKISKLNDRIEDLRSILPGNPGEEPKAVLIEACEYIRELKKSVQKISAELGLASYLYLQPEVEVKVEDEKLEVHIACVNRPGLLLTTVKALEQALESKRMIVIKKGEMKCLNGMLYGDFNFENEVLEDGSRQPLAAEIEAEMKELIVREIHNEMAATNAN